MTDRKRKRPGPNRPGGAAPPSSTTAAVLAVLQQAQIEIVLGLALVIAGFILTAVVGGTLFLLMVLGGLATLIHGYFMVGTPPKRAAFAEAADKPALTGPRVNRVLVGVGLALVYLGLALAIGFANQLFAIVCGLGVGVLYRALVYGWADPWERAGDVMAKYGALPALGVLTLVMAWIYLRVFQGEPVGDDLTFHYAEASRIAECLRGGDWDFWNPSANAGYASAYYYQVIPQLASAIPAAMFGHLLFWFELSVFLPLVLAPAAAYRGLRLLGATPWQALFGGLAIGFTIGASRWGEGSDGTFTIGLYTQTWALAGFPLALGTCARWLRDGRGLPFAVAWGTFVGLCHPFAGVCLAVALVAGVFVRAVATLDVWRSPFARGVISVHLGFPALGIASLGADKLREELASVIGMLATPVSWLVQVAPLALTVAGVVWIVRGWRTRAEHPIARAVLSELSRLYVLGLVLIVATAPGWLTLVVDYSGFGGFPHRVNDEVGPGLVGLLVGKTTQPTFSGYTQGALFDALRPAVITSLLPLVLLFSRGSFLRWLWGPALAYLVLIALGPHLKTGQDDLIPAVRFLGSLQVVLAIGCGAGAVALGTRMWMAAPGSIGDRLVWIFSNGRETRRLVIENAMRTVIAALSAALVVLCTFPGARVLQNRVKVSKDYPLTHRDEMQDIIDRIPGLVDGRKQAGPGAENHWWNLLPYVYANRPALLQMGGGGLQASPNYDYLWSTRDFKKNAWLYDAPIVLFARAAEKKKLAPDGPTVIETQNFEVRTLPSPGLVSAVQVTGVLPPGRVDARQGALAWVKTDAPMHDQMLAYDGSGPAGSPPAGRVNKSWYQASPGDEPDIVAEVEVTLPTTFVARESWHPRWHAYVDGVETRTRRLTPDFVAADVPPGVHTLSFRFERPWWATAVWLLWPLTCLACWLAAWLLARRARPRLPSAVAIVKAGAKSAAGPRVPDAPEAADAPDAPDAPDDSPAKI